MNKLMSDLTFTVRLTKDAHRQAEQFSLHQSHPIKRQQVYCNTLAVYAVNFYCQCMGIETDLANSDSWNIIMQTISDTADLLIKSMGKIECRCLMEDADFVQVPAEVWGDRIGYIAVSLSEDMKQAKLIGFLKSVATEAIPLSSWDSLDGFLEEIACLEKAKQKEPVRLSQWLQNIFDAGWETVEVILGQAEMAYNFKSSSRHTTRNSEASKIVKRGKMLNLQRAGEKIALFVELMSASEPEMDIFVEVFPTGSQMYLPQDLQLMVLDEKGDAVMQAQARTTKNIQLQFSGEPGEQFSVKVGLGDVSITEAFTI